MTYFHVSVALIILLSELYNANCWNPLLDFNETCQIFVNGATSTEGIGDQFEHFIFYLNVAKLLNATLIFTGFDHTIISNHDSFHEYGHIMNNLLGYNLKNVVIKC